MIDNLEASVQARTAELEKANEAVTAAVAIVQAEEGEVIFNFDTDADLPAGYGIVINPINQRDTEAKQTVAVGVTIGAICCL